jgi:uncharacterized protein
MSIDCAAIAGAATVARIWRYPVKSMLGEQVDAAAVDACGVAGDRAYALVEPGTNQVGSAKDPRRWAPLLACRAAFAAEPRPGRPAPPIRLTLPNGRTLVAGGGRADPELDEALADAFGRPLVLAARPPAGAVMVQREPDDPGDGPTREIVMAKAAPGTFFNHAPVHIITTATLARLGELAPGSRFDERRFRPNLVVETPPGETGFVEHDWIGRTLRAGGVTLRVFDPCPRCIVTTLPLEDLPRDSGILRAVAQHASAPSALAAPGRTMTAVAGVYAFVVEGGVIRRGDPIHVSP